MPYFKVMLHGTGIYIQTEKPLETIIGFYTTRLVRAKTDADAITKAKANVETEWVSGKYSKSNNGIAPQLSVESVFRSGLFEWLRFNNSGHSFYLSERRV
jgi:hypothetical protein